MDNLAKEQQEEKDKQPVTLKLITGGKDETPPDDGNWLAKLEIGTIFLCRKISGVKLDNPFLEQCEIESKTDDNRAIKLFMITPDGNKLSAWVLSQTFSSSSRLVAVLGVIVGE